MNLQVKQPPGPWLSQSCLNSKWATLGGQWVDSVSLLFLGTFKKRGQRMIWSKRWGRESHSAWLLGLVLVYAVDDVVSVKGDIKLILFFRNPTIFPQQRKVFLFVCLFLILSGFGKGSGCCCTQMPPECQNPDWQAQWVDPWLHPAILFQIRTCTRTCTRTVGSPLEGISKEKNLTFDSLLLLLILIYSLVSLLLQKYSCWQWSHQTPCEGSKNYAGHTRRILPFTVSPYSPKPTA